MRAHHYKHKELSMLDFFVLVVVMGCSGLLLLGVTVVDLSVVVVGCCVVKKIPHLSVFGNHIRSRSISSLS